MRKFLQGLAWVVGIVAVIVGLLRATVLRWWRIPDDDPGLTTSLAPTLKGGDFVLLWHGSPSIGDLVRCTDPAQPGRWVIGRFMADAGDTISVETVDVQVNEKRTEHEMSCQKSRITIDEPVSGAAVELHCSVEAYRGRKHLRAAKMNGPAQPPQRQIVSDGNVFLVSDNRAYPMDSREYGAVPKVTCTDSVIFRLWSKQGVSDAEARFTSIQ